jgi:hypothetical protein
VPLNISKSTCEEREGKGGEGKREGWRVVCVCVCARARVRAY